MSSASFLLRIWRVVWAALARNGWELKCLAVIQYSPQNFSNEWFDSKQNWSCRYSLASVHVGIGERASFSAIAEKNPSFKKERCNYWMLSETFLCPDLVLWGTLELLTIMYGLWHLDMASLCSRDICQGGCNAPVQIILESGTQILAKRHQE